jgi:hypothetical protein
MRLELYTAETARIAHEQTSLLDQARQRLLASQPLNRLEESGVLHALQVLVENAIGKAKHTIKASNAPVPALLRASWPADDISADGRRQVVPKQGYQTCQSNGIGNRQGVNHE